MSLFRRCERSPTPVSVGENTLWPLPSRRSATRRQHQPPCHAQSSWRMRMSTPANDQLIAEQFLALTIRLIGADLRRRAEVFGGLPLFDFRNRRLAVADRRLEPDV